jgi:ribonuclease HII
MPDFNLEKKYSGIVAGIDEVGRGPLAGPVVAAAVIFLKYVSDYIADLNDSKKLTPKKRTELYNKLIADPNICYDYAIITATEIDQINIFQATQKAMKLAVSKLKIKPDYFLVDGNHKMISNNNAIPVIKGDNISNSIAAASIIAKVIRDNMMHDLAIKYPQYDWLNNAGYGTKKHIEAIAKYGITIYHRKTYAPIKNNYNDYKIICSE